MTRFKVMGSQSRLDAVLSPWQHSNVHIRGGHTVIEDVPTKTKQDIFNDLVTLHSFTAIDTSVPDAPVRVTEFKPDTQKELVFIPQYAGG